MKTKFFKLPFGHRVGHRALVMGTSNAVVQLYVLSNDNKWYLQKPIKFFKKVWFGFCFFGDAKTKSGAKFTIAAKNTPERPKSPVDKLNGIVQSLKVTRK